MTSKPLNRDDILGALDLETDFVHIPRWGGQVLVKAMPMANTRYTQFVTGGSKPPKGGIGPREEFIRRMVGAVILCALDPDTEEPMFKWSDADQLREKHWNSTLKVANKAFELAGDADEEDADDEDEDAEDTDSSTAIEEALNTIGGDTDEDEADAPLDD